MWKEIITDKDISTIVSLRNSFGCTSDFSKDLFKSIREIKKDCHYYYYKSDTIELIKGFCEIKEHIFVLAYTIKANIKDYSKAFELMAKKTKEYIKNRKFKTVVIEFGSENKTSVNLYNKGIGLIGLDECIKLAIPEYEKEGFKLQYNDKQIIVELI